MTSATRAKYLAYQTNSHKRVRNYESMGNIFCARLIPIGTMFAKLDFVAIFAPFCKNVN